MGAYLNPSNDKFRESVNSNIYIDKTELIQYTNSSMGTMNKNICVSRPRRFGKSVAANMLTAYYSSGCDSKKLFQGLKIAQDADFERYLNQYDVIAVNMQEFLSRTHAVTAMLERLNKLVVRDLQRAYPNVDYFDKEDLIQSMQDVYEETGHPFIMIIDEWDCVLREYKQNEEAQKYYLDFLRDLLKDKGNIHLVYMTGILPIKKYGTHSALNMFDEFSMIHAGPLARFFGFTEEELKTLCGKYGMDYEEEKSWYDGYRLKGAGSIYNPRSVISSIQFGDYGDYWNQTETFEALKIYIDMNFEGLRDDILMMMSGEHADVNVGSFTNDMATFSSKHDVLTLLIHLGYLGYDSDAGQVFIPNHEIMNEYVNVIQTAEWGEVSKALELSKKTLHAIWDQREAEVASLIENSHVETSMLQYNDENALSYTLSLALYAARNYYTVHRELAGGKGFADLVFIPRKRFADRPALLVELKWDESAESAIVQIKEKGYVCALEEYRNNLLLVGINYDKKTKKHRCKIERYM